MAGIKNELIGHFHYANPQGQYTNYGNVTSISNTSGQYHIYSLEWTDKIIRIFSCIIKSCIS